MQLCFSSACMLACGMQDEEVGLPRPVSSHPDAQQSSLAGEGERKGQAAYEKAVRQMMGGAPGTAAAAAAVHQGLFADRPSWMSGDPAGFNEEQARQVSTCGHFLHRTAALPRKVSCWHECDWVLMIY